ncbi:MAG: hypothetical protein M3Q56_00665, partial [Bacteroidota bacterium]|nr:hypothetical protein [Bacteroidota bacterium]
MKNFLTRIIPSLFWMLALVCCSTTVFAGLGKSKAPGTSAPPCMLGPYGMARTPVDAVTPEFTNVSSVNTGTCNGNLTFGAPHNLRRVPTSWSNWSHGYTGEVYFTNGATTSVINLPAGTKAFYLYVDPEPLSTFEVIARANDGTADTLQVNGNGGAAYVGFFVNRKGCVLTTITISSTVAFAVGEFGINASPFDVPTAPLIVNVPAGTCLATIPRPALRPGCTVVAADPNGPQTSGTSTSGSYRFSNINVPVPVAPVGNSCPNPVTAPFPNNDLLCGPA